VSAAPTASAAQNDVLPAGVTAVRMPQLGETVTEGCVGRWYADAGCGVAQGETLFDVSTDKVDTELPSPASGTLLRVDVREGETVQVGTILAYVGPAGSPLPPPVTAQVAVAAQTADSATASVIGASSSGASLKAGPSPAISPLIRKLLAQAGLTSDDVTGTGPNGRITRKDVQEAIAARAATMAVETSATWAEAAAAVKQPAPAPQPSATPPTGTHDYRVPFTKLRRVTAERMVTSKATSAHTLIVIDVDYFQVAKARTAHGARFRASHGIGLSYLPFILRAVIDTLPEFPHLNAEVGRDELIVHRELALGIAVDLDSEGLVVPVIRHAADKRLPRLAAEVADLAAAARNRRLGPEAFTGGTFTITNTGPFGTLLTGAVINQPQVAILATDGVAPKPVAIATGDGEYAVVVHPVGNLALTFDHRAVDGAYAARFLHKLRDVLQTRDWATEL
jgi:2-oxoglutarate dehydrogenase E2 component (dihydrolipoamide succinyltransferase)